MRIPVIYEGLYEVCTLCGGDLHQLEACPNLPISKKVEAFMKKL